MESSGARSRASQGRVSGIAVPAMATVLWSLTLIVPASLKPLAASLAGVAGGAVLLALIAWTRRPIGREPARVLALLGLGGIALLAGALAHPYPLVSLAGAVGQHNGWMLWLAVTLWFISGAATGRGTSLRWIMWSFACAGAVSASLALLDVAGLIGAVRYSPEAAGVMESSISLGQFLLIGLGCSTALFASTARPVPKWTAAGFVLVQSAALVLSGARAAILLGLVAAVAAVFWARTRDGRRPAVPLRWFVGAGVVTMIVGVLAVAWTGASENGALQGMLTDRPAIWHSALRKVPENLLVGAGPDRFSAVVDWSAGDEGLVWQTTSSPHNVLFDWVLGGGAVALAAFAAAFAAAGVLIARDVSRAGPGPKLLALFIGAWALSLMTSWTDPFAACAAAVLAGALSAGPATSGRSGVRHAALEWVVAAVAVAACVLVWPLAGMEARWAAIVDGEPATLAESIARWEHWPDPAFGGQALTAGIEGLPGTASETGALASDVLERTPWDANGALRSVQASLILQASAPSVDRPDPANAIETGRRAAPGSGVWDWADEVLLGR